MEKDRFLILVQNFTSLSEEEASELTALRKDYPYSQVIHNLAARAAQDNQSQNYNQLLNLSAVYSTDRSVLKYIMTEPKGRREITEAKRLSIPFEANALDESFHGDELLHEIEIDLAKLKELKHNFELSLEEYERGHLPLPDEKRKGKKTKTNAPPQDDGLIEEIKTTKKEMDLEGEKQKEQIQIIDNFIKTSPTIPKGKLATIASGDLSENSSAFGDHIVSETLVEILIKQGKKDKAIEVLRKLIWKFPQKKAIFATQIEELKG